MHGRYLRRPSFHFLSLTNRLADGEPFLYLRHGGSCDRFSSGDEFRRALESVVAEAAHVRRENEVSGSFP